MMKKETVYPYDESFQKIAKKLPFRGAFLSLARTIQAKMQKEQTLPKGMKKRIFEVSGYQGLPVSVLEIWPSDLSQKPEVPWILDIHGGGFGYEMAGVSAVKRLHIQQKPGMPGISAILSFASGISIPGGSKRRTGSVSASD